MAESHVDRVTGAPGSIHGDASRFRAMGLDDDKRKVKQQRESEGNDPETARLGEQEGDGLGRGLGGYQDWLGPSAREAKMNDY